MPSAITVAAPSKLTDHQIEEALRGVPEWSLVGESIQRTFQFKDFVNAMRFVNDVATEAEMMRHHPDMLIRYSRVTLTLATHDAGGITEKDFAMARQSDSFAARYEGPTAVRISGKTKK